MTAEHLTLGNIEIGPDRPLTVIAGPCLAESRQLCMDVAGALRDRCAALGFGYILKASFDKANRSSIHSERGPGLEAGLSMLDAVKREIGVPVTTDVHEPSQPGAAAEVVDLLQVPAFLCRQTDLLTACARTGKAVNVKKGQFMAPTEMTHVVTKLEEAGDEAGGGGGRIMLTERGTSFGYQRLVNDFLGLGDLMDLGPPVCFDITHSTQAPGAGGTTSGGRPDRAPLLARCAVAAGVHAVFLETHPDPSKAKSDAATMLDLPHALTLLEQLKPLRDAVESTIAHS